MRLFRRRAAGPRPDLVAMHRAAVGPITPEERARLALPAVDGQPAPGARRRDENQARDLTEAARAAAPSPRTVIDRWGSLPTGSYPSGMTWDDTLAEARDVLARVSDAHEADLLTGTDMRAWNNAMTVLDHDRDRRDLAAARARKAAEEARQRRLTAAHRTGVLRDRRTALRRSRTPALLRREWRADRKADRR